MSGQQGDKPWVDEATGTGMPWPPSKPVPVCNGAPPLVPTTEAVERWGHLWWRQMGGTAEVVLVTNFAADDPVAPLGFYEPISRTPRRVESDCFWAGPVLERPVKP